ncbi:MAG TPA: ATP-binding protein [Planctomycetota bacterium]
MSAAGGGPSMAGVLIVEDDPRQRAAVSEAIADPRYDLVMADTGRAALSTILDRDFAAILLDARLPDMEGFELARLLRLGERTRDTPILFLTGPDPPAERLADFAAVGAIDFLRKPVDAGLLRGKVRTLVGLFEARRDLERTVHERTEALLRVNETLRREVEERRRVEDDLRAATERAIRHREALAELARAPSAPLPAALRLVTEKLSAILAVERVSVWRYTPDRSEIDCLDLYVRSAGTHERGLRLRAGDYPRYFAALGESRSVAASDARTDPRTVEFARDYLVPLGITSMLDVPIRVDGTLEGIVCHEHTGARRAWPGEEQDFASSVADLVALAMEAAERRAADAEVRRLNDDLEDRVRERTRELEEALREVEAFSYTVSHDLRAPLRTIRGYSDILVQEWGAALGAEGGEHLRRITLGAERMEVLIEGLLSYSRLGRSEVNPTPLNPTEVLSEVMAGMAADLGASGAAIEVEADLLRVLGDRMMLAIAIQNLLSNAVKFVAPGVRPRVKIRTEARGDRVRILVEDNGIGIAPEHRVKLFRVFERLVRKDEYPGTGIGLATVRRALERMGGSWGFESEPGHGSVFWIELRKGP